MSYHHTLEAALESLRDIEALVKGFQTDEIIPGIEIDLALQKMRNLYELMLMIKSEDRLPENTVSIEDKSVVIKTEKEYTAVKEEKKTDTAVPVANNNESVEVTLTSKKKEIVESQIKTVADKFTGHKTLHETLSRSNTKENNLIANSKPLIDLFSAIGINDRFTFIKEMFNNDKAAFETTMDTLNNLSSFNDAYNYIIRNFDWDMDSEPVQSLLEIIRRKFIKSRDV